jgi:hypothetical protein
VSGGLTFPLIFLSEIHKTAHCDLPTRYLRISLINQ